MEHVKLVAAKETAGLGSEIRIVLPPMKPTGVKVKVVIHRAEEGGFWAEVPALPGCATQGETREELLANLREAVEGSLCVFPGDYKQEEPGWEEEVEI